VDERVAPGEDIANRDVLAEHRSSGLGAVRGHVEEGAAAGEVGVPEMRRMRAAVALASSERRQPTDRSRLDHLAHSDHLGVEDDILEVGIEDAGVADEAEHLGGLLRVSAERLRAGDPLAVARRGTNRVEVEVVRERDHDEVDLGVGTDRVDGVEGTAAEPLGERLAPLRAGAPVRDHPGVVDVAQPECVELADEAGAEHADADGAHLRHQ
jgi:hypothetical protein